jgi:DNA-binding helix-hairpin-helix protein with protein kinase domain
MIQILKRSNGSPVRLGRELARGGEGTIYQVVGEPRLVAKIYHPHKITPERVKKLGMMLSHPPQDPMRQRGHISIAWPVDAILNGQGKWVGFLMPFVDTSKSIPLFKLYNPHDRRQSIPGFTWRYLLRTACNLASILSALHKNNYVVGDLNESNILVTKTALVSLVDCDSIQVRGGGQIFHCAVGKAEYTPPELQGHDLAKVDRTVHHDNFGLAILIFLLLMEGRHPFTGVWRSSGTPPTIEQNIHAGNCPYINANRLTPPPGALDFSMLPSPLRRLMKQCFADGLNRPSQRPLAESWYHTLTRAEQELVICRLNTQHVYSRHLRRCPWCERINRGIPDPFPPVA